MGEVDKHPKPRGFGEGQDCLVEWIIATRNSAGFISIHLLDQFNGEVREPEWLENSTRAGESVVASVGECRIPDPKGAVLSKNRE